MLAYAFRSTPFARERSYRLDPDGLTCDTAGSARCVAYADITQVRFYRQRTRHASGANGAPLCTLRCRQGPNIDLRPLHTVRLGVREDRSLRYLLFVSELKARVLAANPQAEILVEPRRSPMGKGALGSLQGRIALGVFRSLRPIGPDTLAAIAGWLASRIGPYTGLHRIARTNLAAAYPEMSSSERERILVGMWDNAGRCAAEYFHLDRLWDYEPGKPPGRIVPDHPSLERLRKLRDGGEPALVFTAHLANFELLGRAGAAFGVDFAVVYQQPGNAPFAEALWKLRSRLIGAESFIEHGQGTAFELKTALRHNRCIVNVIDRHQRGGVDVVFFGRPCKANPTLARLARKFELPILGARAVRLPGHRFTGELTEPITPPRDASGQIDVAGTMQVITSQVEAWVREHPEQWPWFYRRWR